MQTFLPVPDFHESARMLDYRRLGKQRVEAKQIINAITNAGGWSHHPATVMWASSLAALKTYHDVCIREWIRRGHRNSMVMFNERAYVLPPWFGSPEFHAAHRAALLFKDWDWYARFGWEETPRIAYLWPTPTN